MSRMYTQVTFLGFFAVLIGLRQNYEIDLSFGLVEKIQHEINLDITESKLEILACFLFAGFVCLSLVMLRTIAMIRLLSYMGWMYDSRGKISWRTKVWGVLIKTFVSSKSKIFDMQQFLPFLPLPTLDETITRYLRTVRPLLDDEAYKRLTDEANEFKKGAGARFQFYLRLKWLLTSNYVSDLWEQFAYLKSRSPLACNSNVYGLEAMNTVWTNRPESRAANISSLFVAFSETIQRNELNPIMIQNSVPLCNYQYVRQFNTTRVPGEAIDKLVHLKESSHIAVFANGKWYKVSTYHNGERLNAKELEIQFQRILNDSTESSKVEKYLGSLTAGNRTTWAIARQRFFSEGVNKHSLAMIEDAAFVVSFDEESYDVINSGEDKKLDAYGKSMLHGKIYNRWFDKSLNLVIGKNGRIGCNAEHSWADAPVTSHMWECVTHDDYFKLGYDKNGYANGQSRFSDLPQPTRLEWDLSYEVEQMIMTSYEEALSVAENTDLHIYIHDLFGKKEFKRCKTSPDAFIQMALQLAYYTEFGRHDLTYESSMTRLFRYGRTETIRSCSIESCNWVKSMKDPNATKEERLRLFKLACDYHQVQCRDAMCGRAVDRHLFSLYIISNYLKHDSPFLTEVLSQPWRLSTSQTAPNQANLVDLNKYPDFRPLGGGFGPVNEDGYGVSYVFCDDNTITFHVSSKHSCDKTDSYRFGQHIRQSLMDIKGLFDN